MTTRQPSTQAAREPPDPHEAGSPIPAWILLLALLLAFSGAYYIVRADRDGAAAARRTAAAAPAAGRDDAAGDGAGIFAARCAACHQTNGAGVPGVFPPLAASSWVTGPDARLVQLVLRGVQGPLTVGGVTFNGVMPGFGGQLDDAGLAAVLTYARGHWGNAAPVIAAATVATQRAAARGHEAPWQGEAELAAAP